MDDAERERLEQRDEAKLEELEREHRRIAYFYSDEGGLLVFKKPAASDWERFTEKISKGLGTRLSAARELCFAALVHPDRAELTRVLEEEPGLPTAIAGELGEMVGATKEAEGKGRAKSGSRRSGTSH